MANFSEILDRPLDDIAPPPLLPVGTYVTTLVGLPEQGESSVKKTPQLTFTHRILAAQDDVDADALAEIEGGVAGKEIKNTFYLSDASLFMLKNFIEHCGIPTEGRSLAAAIDEMPNAQVCIHIKHEPSQDGQRIFARVGRTAPVE